MTTSFVIAWASLPSARPVTSAVSSSCHHGPRRPRSPVPSGRSAGDPGDREPLDLGEMAAGRGHDRERLPRRGSEGDPGGPGTCLAARAQTAEGADRFHLRRPPDLDPDALVDTGDL